MSVVEREITKVTLSLSLGLYLETCSPAFTVLNESDLRNCYRNGCPALGDFPHGFRVNLKRNSVVLHRPQARNSV